ncbi:hypothetical protein BKP45_10040 [Anaerobacillus alkalidiazotrophicus]|uniref:Uncharacterized protein n=1 Tax=Anaerobacillus alkalidiazotrophicus TaxID=472963 RepID=A0A1S2M5U6_9BACI|nr:hypothetical protein [Anaerobacillus alkalidiazotrophicus]OIJ20119.1 hypothetical protein BKP45_10040 [Anaerobacillus alkalidiazotrophicus]
MKFSFISIFLIGTLAYITTTYYFNPITFKKDDVTYLEWSWYKKPLTLEYLVLEGDDWKVKYIDDENEIKFVFDELKKSPIIYNFEIEYKSEIREVIVRSGDGGILLRVRQEWAGDKFILKHNMTYLELTDDLIELFDNRFLQAE